MINIGKVNYDTGSYLIIGTDNFHNILTINYGG